jgi:hypothetical protein
MLGEGRPARKADNLTAIYAPTVYKMCDPRRLTNIIAFTAGYRRNLTIFLLAWIPSYFAA